ncbi:MAG TPA: efflux RND transporter permease subunit [Terriglobia bacterium]|nr:efflux RND transporter permease subunit [Terriglobia bacterium]
MAIRFAPRVSTWPMRMRPSVMTALAAVVGMLPLALVFGARSQMLHRLAIAVIGGF